MPLPLEVRAEVVTAHAEDIAIRTEQRRIMAPFAVKLGTGAGAC